MIWNSFLNILKLDNNLVPNQKNTSFFLELLLQAINSITTARETHHYFLSISSYIKLIPFSPAYSIDKLHSCGKIGSQQNNLSGGKNGLQNQVTGPACPTGPNHACGSTGGKTAGVLWQSLWRCDGLSW
jgi:hypothetical protein